MSVSSNPATTDDLVTIVAAADEAFDLYREAVSQGDVLGAELAWSDYRAHLGYVLDSVDVLLATKA